MSKAPLFLVQKKPFVNTLCVYIFKIVTHFIRFFRDCSFTLISVEQNTY